MSDRTTSSGGRLYYIEPNKASGTIIPQKYEDYCIAVDLQIEKRRRGDYGDSDNIESVTYSSGDGTISFMNGTNGALTTNYTDLSPINKNEISECIGIRSINITHNSWFYPQVTIRFVDVRGAGLMVPAEEGWQTGDVKKRGTFFDTLFSYPYPLVKLKVKGFYGKGVTYRLALSKFSGELNGETGDFEINAEFIGYMYGLFGDLPLTFCTVAPYMSYEGASYWNSKLGSTFKYAGSNQPLYKYTELSKAISEFNKNAPHTINNSNMSEAEKINEMRNRVTAIEKIRDSYVAILDYLFGANNYGYIKNAQRASEEKDIIGLFKNGSTPKIALLQQRKVQGRATYYCKSDTYYLSSGIAFGDGAMRNKDEELLRLINEYNGDAKNNGYKISAEPTWLIKLRSGDKVFHVYSLRSSDQAIAEIGGGGSYYLYNAWLYNNTNLGTDGNITFVNNSDGYSNENVRALDELYRTSTNFKKLDELCSRRSTTSRNLETYFLFRLTDNRLLEELDEKLVEYRKEAEAYERENKQKILNAEMSRQLGFAPTVGNAYRMLFAHMETFLQSFFKCLDNIKKQENNGLRSKDDVRGGETDIPDDRNKLYPFTIFLKEVTDPVSGVKRKEIVLPEDVGLENLEEMKFVDSLLGATKEYIDTVATQDQAVEEGRIGDTEYYPLTLYDIAKCGETNNPYTSIPAEKSRLIAEYIMMTYAQRYLDYCTGLEEMDANSAEMFGKLEAYNLYKRLEGDQTLTDAARSYFINVDKYSNSKFVTNLRLYLSSTDDTKIINTVNGHSDAFLKGATFLNYFWFKKNNQKWLPTGIYSVSDIGSSWIRENSNNSLGNSNNWICEDASGNTGGKFFIGKKVETLDTIADKASSVGCDKTQYLKKTMPRYGVGEAQGNPKCFPNYQGREGDLSNLFFNPQYYAQNLHSDLNTRKLAKAYMLACVCNAPKEKIGGGFESMMKDVCKLKNGAYRKGDLLMIGAMLWRKQYIKEHNEDPIKVKYEDTFTFNGSQKTYTTSQVAIAHENASYYTQSGFVVAPDFSCKEASKYMLFIDDKNYTKEKSDVLIKFFTDWADNEFEMKIRQPLEMVDKEGKPVGPGLIWHLMSNMSSLEVLSQHLTIKANMRDVTLSDAYNFKGAQHGYGFADINGEYLVNMTSTNALTSFNDMYSVTDLRGKNIGLTPKDRVFSINGGQFDAAAAMFRKTLGDLLGSGGTVTSTAQTSDTSATTDPESIERNLRLSTYLSLKGLYDKWLCGNNRNKWKLDELGSTSHSDINEFESFLYLDGLNNNIKESFCVNVDKLSSRVKEISTGIGGDRVSDSTFLQQSKSVYEYMSMICTDNNMVLLALPTYPDIKSEGDMEELFTAYAYPYWDTVDTSSYICLYTGKNSAHLNTSDDYRNDSFNFADAYGNISTNLPVELADGSDGAGRVGAFGVTYAKPNQSYFKKVTVSTMNPTQTEASIMAEKAIADKGSEQPRGTLLYGQDIYKLYHGYMYSCQVEMLGNARICPTMYFQLNNIPLFRGAYQIIKVEHEITAGNMTTTFTGVRMCAHNIPLAKFDPM